MNIWLMAATGLLWGLIPCGIVCLRGDPVERLAGLEAAGSLASVILLLAAEGFHRLPFFDVALTMALLSFGGGLVFAYFMARWL